MSVRRIFPTIAPERALRSQASAFRDQLQLAHKLAPRAPRFAPVSAEGGGRDPGSLYLGGSPAMHRPWSFAPMHHDVAADVGRQDTLAQVETQERVVQDGWEHTITSEQQRQAEAATAAAEAELEEAQAAFEAGLDEFNEDWAAEHDGVSVASDGTLILPADQYDALAAEWEQDLQDEYAEQVGDAYGTYGEAVAQELRQAALEAEARGEDPNQAVSEQADEIRARDTEVGIAADAIDAAEAQVLGESQEVRAARLDYGNEGQELESALDTLESAEALPDTVADKPETLAAAEAAAAEAAAEADEAAAALEAAIAEQQEGLGREVLIKLADQFGVTAPNADHYRPGELPQTLTDLSDEELTTLIQEALGKFSDPQSVTEALELLDEDTCNALATALGVEPDQLGAVISDPGQLVETLGAEDEEAALDVLADEIIGMAAGEVSDAHGDNPYIDGLLNGDEVRAGVVDQVAVDLRVGEMARMIEAIDPEELSGVEQELWEAGDQVSVALLRQLGVSFVETQDVRPEGGGLNYGDECVYAIIDGERVRLSGAEEELLNNGDATTLALFLKAGFRLEGGTGSEAIGLGFDGESYTPAELTQTLVAEGRLSAQDQQAVAGWLEEMLAQAQGNPDALAAIAGGLWWYGNDAESLAAEAAVAGALRLEQTGDAVSALLAEGKADEAQQLLTANMDAAVSEEERALLWQRVGLEHFGEDYWAAELDGFIADYEDYRAVDGERRDGPIADSEGSLSLALGNWFKGMKDDISPEMAQIILGLVEDKVDVDMLDADDSAFFHGLSVIVSIADQRAEPATSWAEKMAGWLLQPTQDHPEGYELSRGAVTVAIVNGAGRALADAYAASAEARGLLADGDYQEWQHAIDEASRHPKAAAEYAALQFDFFEENKHTIVPDYLERIMGQEGIGEAQEVVYGDALRDLIAAGMDLDWRHNDVDRDTVDTIMDEMFNEAGIGADERKTTAITVTVVPYIYAAERDGWATGALFDVDGPDEEVERTVTGGGYATTVTETDPHDFVIDGGVIANLASQAAAQGTTIDAITNEQPWRFDSVKHFQDKNYLAEKGLLYLPYELGMQYGLAMEQFGASADNAVRLGTTAAAVETTGEKIWEAVDIGVTLASIAAMAIPIGGALVSFSLRGASVATKIARGALWASTLYGAGRGVAQLDEMGELGIDIGWSNPVARSIYVEMLGNLAASLAIGGGVLFRRSLTASGPGHATTAARAAYLVTQALNTADLCIGAYGTLDGAGQLIRAGDDASAWQWLMTAMGGATLTMGGIGMRHDSRAFNNHLNLTPREYIQNAIADEAGELWRQDGEPAKGAAAYLSEAAANRFQSLIQERTNHHFLQAGKPHGGSGAYRDQATNEVYQYAAEYLAQERADPTTVAAALIPEIFRRPQAYSSSEKVPSLDQLLRGYSSTLESQLASQLGGKIPELDAALLKSSGFAPDNRKVPNVNVGKIAVGTILARAIADIIGLSSGHWERYNEVGGKAISAAAYSRSSGSKWAWLDRNHDGGIKPYALAALGRTEDAKRKLDKVEGRTRLHGAAAPSEAERREHRASLDFVGQVGENYQRVLKDLPSPLKKVLPNADLRKMFTPEKIVEGWLPKNLENASDIQAILMAVDDRMGIEYYGRNRNTRTELAKKLDKLTFDELNGLPQGGVLKERLARTLEARQAYRALHKALCDELGQADDGKVNYRGAESKLSSSMSPDNLLGLIFKSGSFVGAANILLAWVHKDSPLDADLIDHLSYWGDVVQAGPVIVIQALYLRILQIKREFLEKHPDRSSWSADEEAEFQAIEAARKLLNTLADYTSVLSGLRNIFMGISYWQNGEYGLALGSFLQAGSSFAWVAVQQTPNIDRAGTYLLEGFKHLNQGDIGLAIPAFKEARKSITGAAGQQSPEWLRINPNVKAVMRWSSIACGLIVPTLILIEEILSDEEKEKKGPSVWDRTYGGLQALVGEMAASDGTPTGPHEESIALPDQPTGSPEMPSPVNVHPGPLTVISQLVVMAEDGLNLREGPSADAAIVTVLPRGALVEGATVHAIDEDGSVWVPVSAYSPEGWQRQGWVSGDFVEKTTAQTAI
jgi:hypothetical protein